jgi:hypothetical protein
MRHTSYSEVGNLPLGSKFYLEDHPCEVVSQSRSTQVHCVYIGARRGHIYLDVNEFVEVIS